MQRFVVGTLGTRHLFTVRESGSVELLGHNKHVPAAAEGKPSAQCSQVHRNKRRPTQELASGLSMSDVTVGRSLGESCAVLKVRPAGKGET